MPTPEYHADRSPSSAKQWLNCTPSLRMSDSFPKKTSEYAEAGRLAHAIAELKAQKRYMKLSKRSYESQLKKLQESPSYSPEMEGYTDLYIETLDQHAMSFKSMPFTALETSVPIGEYTHEVKEDGSPATGTADCIQIGEGVLWVTDYKNGSGVPVSAEDNPQMKIYSLGALLLYTPIYGDTIQKIKMTIVQPALKSISDWEISRNELEAWGSDELSPKAALAAAGIGELNADPNPNGWCKFCPAYSTCPEQARAMFSIIDDYKLGVPKESLPDGWADTIKQDGHGPFGTPTRKLLTDEEVSDALTRGAQIIAWYNSLKDYAEQALLQGKKIPGYKLVCGRSSRDWDNVDAAFADLKICGIDDAILYERKPITPPALEKALGKGVFAELASSHIVYSQGKPTIVQESDKRHAYNAAELAFGGVADG